MAKLILATAEGQQSIDLRPTNSLGRHPNNSIQLLDKIVSKEHCIVELRDGHFVLRDLGSLNGTYVNGERVRGETRLKHGDEIALGSTRACFDDGSGGAFAPPPVGPGAVERMIGGGSSWPSGPATAPRVPPAATPASPQPPPIASQVVSARGGPPHPVPAGSGLQRPAAATRVDVLDADSLVTAFINLLFDELSVHSLPPLEG